MPIESHLHDALLFALIALALVLIALLFRSPARHTMLGMLIVTAVGVLGLWVFENSVNRSSRGRARSWPARRDSSSSRSA